ncbi:hypothetical protein J2X36_004522 [Methylobacterium sp. BE186]|uniref:hypothetical protein n=1 Tax=Methylobacterium sp. BE186 TaxID=2817715 RepID=UPI0028603545|nr:hypothetical protein [Methylobacterium sp. BE186]MDR7039744.1 hypothetical protein [Methylobacterium sp. BE186]
MDHELERLDVRAEDGAVRVMIAWQAFVRTGGLSGSHILKDQRRYSLLNGAAVEYLGNDAFKEASSGAILLRIKV